MVVDVDVVVDDHVDLVGDGDGDGDVAGDARPRPATATKPAGIRPSGWISVGSPRRDGVNGHVAVAVADKVHGAVNDHDHDHVHVNERWALGGTP